MGIVTALADKMAQSPWRGGRESFGWCPWLTPGALWTRRILCG